jgi:hypothetical protein
VEAADDRWRLPDGVRRLPEGLVVAPPPAREVLEDPRPVLRTLASQGVIAIAVADPTPQPRPAWTVPDLLVAARGVGLPLLAATSPGSVSQLHTLILRRQVEALAAGRRQITSLLAETRRLDRQGEGPGPLLRWLSDQTSSTVTIVAQRESEAWAALAEHGRVLEQLVAGRMDSAAVELDGRHIRLHALGARAPRQVLAAIRDAPWPRHLTELISQAAGQVTLLQQPWALRTQERRLQASAMALKVGILQHLMAGDTVQATRLAAPLLPDLLASEAAEVCVVGCAEDEERTAVAEACDEALDRRALVVMCPAEHTHVIIIHPPHRGPARSRGPAQADAGRPPGAGRGHQPAGGVDRDRVRLHRSGAGPGQSPARGGPHLDRRRGRAARAPSVPAGPCVGSRGTGSAAGTAGRRTA